VPAGTDDGVSSPSSACEKQGETATHEESTASTLTNNAQQQVESLLSLVATLLLIKANVETFVNEGGVPCVLESITLSISLPLTYSVLNTIVQFG